MLLVTAFAETGAVAKRKLELAFELRQKARFRATLDDGAEVGVQLPRGKVMRGGDRLVAEDGSIIEVVAAPESVTTVQCADPLLLARVCYHLGNRHVPLQIGEGFCRYQHDHVLDDMVRLLGAVFAHEQAPFEPEAGAYHGSHDHGHSHHH